MSVRNFVANVAILAIIGFTIVLGLVAVIANRDNFAGAVWPTSLYVAIDVTLLGIIACAFGSSFLIPKAFFGKSVFAWFLDRTILLLLLVLFWQAAGPDAQFSFAQFIAEGHGEFVVNLAQGSDTLLGLALIVVKMAVSVGWRVILFAWVVVFPIAFLHRATKPKESSDEQ